MAFHPKEKVVAASGSSEIYLWDIPSRRLLHFWNGHRGKRITNLAYSPDGKWLSAGHGGYVNIHSQDHAVRIWDAGTGHIHRMLKGHAGGVDAIAFDSEAKWLASGGGEGRVIVWDLMSGDLVFESTHQESAIRGLVFRPGDSQLLIGRSNGEIECCDLEGGQVDVATTVSGGCEVLEMSPNGQYLAVAGRDGLIRIVSSDQFEPIAALKHEDVTCLAFALAGDILASGGRDRHVRLWDVDTWTEMLSFPPHGGVVRKVAFDHDDKYLAVCGQNRDVTLWDLSLLGFELAELRLDWGSG